MIHPSKCLSSNSMANFLH